jgi:hypothetical protein
MQSRWIMVLTAAGFTADALYRRARAARLTPLPPSEKPVDDDHVFVTAAGVELDEATRRAASAHAATRGLQVLDLVPAGLDSARAMELVRRLDPATYRRGRLAQGGGGGHAVLVAAEVLERSGITRLDGLTAAELDEHVLRLKRYAPVGTDMAVTPGIAPVVCSPADRRAILRRRWLGDLPVYLTGNLLALAALGGVLVRCLAVERTRRLGGALCGSAMIAAACAQPYLATAGTPLRPHDRRRFALSRPLAAPWRWLRVAGVRE